MTPTRRGFLALATGRSVAKAWQEMLGAGVKRIQSADVAV
jgi:hypothetical protein